MSGEQLWGKIAAMVGEAEQLLRSNGATTTNTTTNTATNTATATATATATTTAKTSANTICVAATCSMVVMERVEQDNSTWYQAIDPGNEVIVWMDRRAEQEARQVSPRLLEEALAQIGGAVTPEMGLAKLQWVSNHWGGRGREVVVFELYDWISYVFLAGGYCEGRVRALANDLPVFPVGLSAMDGSVKGWGHDVLAGLAVKVGCAPRQAAKSGAGIAAGTRPQSGPQFATGPGRAEGEVSEFGSEHEPGEIRSESEPGEIGSENEPGEIGSENETSEIRSESETGEMVSEHGPGSRLGVKSGVTYSTGAEFPYVGTELGQCPPGLVLEGATVCHGCIDCYGGWAGLARCQTGETTPSESFSESFSESPTGTSLTMVAGTLTCFIADVQSANPRPIPGIWGPFTQLGPRAVYSFGQPATGQLFAELFAAHAATAGVSAPFDLVESRASHLESTHGASLTVLARHYLYYGDRHGNRSPYGDFSMGEVFVDGRNGPSGTGNGTGNQITMPAWALSNSTSLDSLVLKYYLTLEFLVFQTRQLCARLQEATAPLQAVTVCGSQAHNRRLMRMLAAAAFDSAPVSVGAEAKFAGAQGVAVAAAPKDPGLSRSAGQTKSATSANFAQMAPALSTRRLGPEPLCRRDFEILDVKYRCWVQLAEWQAQFRTALASV